ncbi:MAG: nucleotidyltransferase domain-containing protein [Candidatus Bathyarchaeota archaeon]|nr:nucleotidyltransferase domain-containing protein [Candidatus Bathyarchaeota archaeon]MCX8176932.1 nucleotidyltransferase domain-containing protein [Candidatus Bathyarchaeota archaeon]MDW8193381.1 nucleotidyltransferase domain-containing protein [Nitrososphaerota archaeon]
MLIDMAVKPSRRIEYKEVTYTDEQWILLRNLRDKAMRLMEILEKSNIKTIVHGSIARGDVKEKSDIDIFIPEPPSSFIMETSIERAGIPINKRLIVQATPIYAMKAYIEIDERTYISFPLMRMRKTEREFYRFGGEATLEDLRLDRRLSGVDKRLMLIEPTEKGHRESCILGNESYVARILGVSLETVLDRVHALMRRDEVGRTGVFIEKEVGENETFEQVLEKLAEQNPAVRRRLKNI